MVYGIDIFAWGQGDVCDALLSRLFDVIPSRDITTNSFDGSFVNCSYFPSNFPNLAHERSQPQLTLEHISLQFQDQSRSWLPM